jgi:hypothetical protein
MVVYSGGSKVANLKIAVLIDENVAGLEVAMNNARRMQVLEASLRDIKWYSNKRVRSDVRKSDKQSTGRTALPAA